MKLQDRIEILSLLGAHLKSIQTKEIEECILASQINPWFTLTNIDYSLKAIADNYLDKTKLQSWIEPYLNTMEKNTAKNIGLVMAGNVPLVGFHDFLSVFVSGHHSIIKLSSKDNVLFTLIYNYLCEIEPTSQNYISFVDRLENIDAVVATGSNNSSRYFKYYFDKYPNIIRKNRTSVAIFNNEESEEDFKELGKGPIYAFWFGLSKCI